MWWTYTWGNLIEDNMRTMATIQLKHLTLPRLIDAAYMCGLDRQPVFLYIAAEPGTGKTYSTKSLETVNGVTYFSASYSPNEYKLHVKEVAKHTLLLLHDDIGRCNPSYAQDYISAFCDITEGHIEFRQFKKNINADFNFSAVFTSTLGWFYKWRDVMAETGFMDRVLPIQLELHPNTEAAYRTKCTDDALEGNLSNDPCPRAITNLKKHSPMELYNVKIASRNIRNVLRLSCYLEEPEMIELMQIIQSDKPKYSI